MTRLAEHFGIGVKDAYRRFTKLVQGERSLRHQSDTVFKGICRFFDTDKRRCTVYEARPAICREYPGSRCGYWDFLSFERAAQRVPDLVIKAES